MQTKDARKASQRCPLLENVRRVALTDIAELTLIKNDIFDGAVFPDCCPLSEFEHRWMIDSDLWCLGDPWDADVKADSCSFGAASA